MGQRYGVDWWLAPDLLSALDAKRTADIEQVRRRIRNRRLPLMTGQVVAGLSFGFWVGMLQPRYNPPIWGGHLRSAFPDLPTSRGRASLAEAAARAAWPRNRIWHHEPILKLDLSAEHAAIMRLLESLSPSKAAWIKPLCRLPLLLRSKP